MSWALAEECAMVPLAMPNTDAGGRGVVVVDGGMLGEVDAGGSGVCYAGVVDWQIGWVGCWRWLGCRQ